MFFVYDVSFSLYKLQIYFKLNELSLFLIKDFTPLNRFLNLTLIRLNVSLQILNLNVWVDRIHNIFGTIIADFAIGALRRVARDRQRGIKQQVEPV